MSNYPKRIGESFDRLEQKGIVRRVRTDAGVRQYGLPKGSVIVAGKKPKASKIQPGKPDQAARRRGGKIEMAPNVPPEMAGGIEPKPKGHYKKELLKRLGGAESYGGGWYGGESDSISVAKILLNGGGTKYRATYKDNSTHQRDPVKQENGYGYEFEADTPDEAFELAAEYAVARDIRINETSSERDQFGLVHRNSAPRDFDALMAYDPGVRGVDYWGDGDDTIDWDDPDSRIQAGKRHSAELGYTWVEDDGTGIGKSNGKRINPAALETINRVLQSHEDQYPGFGTLFDKMVLDDSYAPKRGAMGWNLNDAKWDGGYNNVLGWSSKFFGSGANLPNAWNDLAMHTARSKKKKVRHLSIDVPAIAEKHDLKPWEVAMMGTVTHELGHSIGFILWNRMGLNQRVDPQQNEHYDPDKHVGSWFREEMIQLLDYYGVLGEYFPRETSNGYATATSGSSSSYDEQQRIQNDRPYGRGNAHSGKGVLNHGAMAEHLSSYGATNFQEIMAETWTAFQMDEEPGDFVREFGNLMERAMQTWIDESAEARGEL